VKGGEGLAVVTGASSGIGAAFARLLAAEGRPVLLVSRSGDRLAALTSRLNAERGGRAEVLAADLATPEGRDALWNATEGEGRPVALLVNNAGFGLNGPETDLPFERVHALLELNVVATAELTHRFLVAMKARGGGAILNVASTSAFYPTPYFSLYGASKAFILNFTHAIHEEARAFGVTATCLCPGFTRTNFATVAGMREGRETPFPEMTPEAVAKIGLEAVRRRKAVVVTHPLDRAWIAAGRLVPRWVPAKLGVRFFKKMKIS
jgi:short-subunit dehydrogenase